MKILYILLITMLLGCDTQAEVKAKYRIYSYQSTPYDTNDYILTKYGCVTFKDINNNKEIIICNNLAIVEL